MNKIVILDGYTENPGDLSWDALEELGELTVYVRTKPADIVSRIGDANIIFTNKTGLTAEILAACPKLQYVGALSTGYNVIDVEAARRLGIVVTNIPTYGTDAVGQYTIAMLLELCHHIGHHNQAVHQGKWEACPDFCFWDYPMMELTGKTMGIIGYGHIGQTVAGIAQALGMNILAYKRHPDKGLERKNLHFVELDELYARSDVISLHCPLFPETTGMINQDSISKMKDQVLILNTGRGPLIVEEDLAQALRTGKVAGAAVDVVSQEPIQGNNPLLTAPNCIITPHIAWAARETRERLMNIAVDNLKNFLDGTPVNRV